jgi:hypothetical protein
MAFRWLFQNTISTRFKRRLGDRLFCLTSPVMQRLGNYPSGTPSPFRRNYLQRLFLYLLRNFTDNLIVVQLVKKYPVFYGTWMLITVSPSMVHTLSQINPLHNITPHIHSGLFFLSFPTKILYELLTSPCVLMIRPHHYPVCSIIIIGKE